jgi:dihydropteroate synthase
VNNADPATPTTTATLRCGDATFQLGTRTYVMGIVNVTPDSFSDGGQFADADDAYRHACRLLEDGADVLDVGGESTRPGAQQLEVAEELARVVPVIEQLVRAGIRQISVDTRRASVARVALDAGASWVNDVSGLADAQMASVAAGADGVVVMHWRRAAFDGVQDHVEYDDVVVEVTEALRTIVERAVASGVPRERIVVDPGIGFGKTVEHNVRLLAEGVEALRTTAPVLIGPSRKRFLGALSGEKDASRRDPATLAACCVGALHGASFVRVHDVRGARQALSVIEAVRAQ